MSNGKKIGACEGIVVLLGEYRKDWQFGEERKENVNLNCLSLVALILLKERK